MVVKLMVVSMIGIVASMAHPQFDSFADGYNSLAARDLSHSRRTADLDFPPRLIPRSHRQTNLLRRATKGAALSKSFSSPAMSGPSMQQAGLSRAGLSAPKPRSSVASSPHQQNGGSHQRTNGPSIGNHGGHQTSTGNGDLIAYRPPPGGGLEIIPPTPWTPERTTEFQKLALKHGTFDKPNGGGRVPMSAVQHLL